MCRRLVFPLLIVLVQHLSSPAAAKTPEEFVSQRLFQDASKLEHLNVIPDRNGDGTPDIFVVEVVGGFSIYFPYAKRFRLLSGRDFSSLPGDAQLQFNGHPSSAETPGQVTLYDYNRDGVLDYVVGFPKANVNFQAIDEDGLPFEDTYYGAGTIKIFSGSSLNVLFQIDGNDHGLEMGRAFAFEDLDADQLPELIYPGVGNDFSVNIISPGRGQTVCSSSVATPLSSYSPQFLVVRDHNADGHKDVLVSSDYSDVAGVDYGGKVVIVSGRTCELATVAQGVVTSKGAITLLGTSIQNSGDINKDGVRDVLLGGTGGTIILSGANLSQLQVFVEFTPAGNFERAEGAYAFSSPGDVGGDGIADVFSVRRLSSYPRHSVGTILSGSPENQSDGALGFFDFSVLHPHADSSAYVRMFDSVGYDGDSDGIVDQLFASSGALKVSPTSSINGTLLHRMSGACPQVPQIIINPADSELVPVGSINAKATVEACGIRLPGRVTFSLDGASLQGFDTGQDGDETSGDQVYTTPLKLAAGVKKIAVQAVAVGDRGFNVQGSATVQAVGNYIASPTQYTWTQPDPTLQLRNVTSDGVQEVALPFPISFYGRPVSTFQVLASGVIHAGGGTDITPRGSDLLAVGARLPAPEFRFGIIAPLWGNLAVSPNSKVYGQTLGSVGARQFVVTWESFEFRKESNAQGEASRADFQIVFFENSPNIRVNFKRLYSSVPFKAQGGVSTTGLQGGKLLGVTYNYRDTKIKDETAIEFIPESGGAQATNPGGGGNNGGGGQVGADLQYRIKANLKIASNSKSRSSFQIEIKDASSNVTSLGGSCGLSLLSAEATKAPKVFTKVIGVVSPSAANRKILLPKLALPKQKLSGKKKLQYFLVAKLQCGQASQLSNVLNVKSSGTNSGASFTAWSKSLLKMIAKAK